MSSGAPGITHENLLRQLESAFQPARQLAERLHPPKYIEARRGK